MTITAPPAPPDAAPRGRGPRWPYVAAAVVLAVAAVIFVVTGGDDSTPTTTSTTSTLTTPTTAAPTTVTTVPATLPAAEAALAAFPAPSGTTRYDDPIALTRAFATDLVGFVDPVVGELRAGDARSGEVDIRPRADGPATTVLVRQLSDGTWWVLGAFTAAIDVTTPAARDAVASPIALAGRSTAFEATVDVEVRQDGTDAALGRGWVMGGANGEMGPFTGTLEMNVPSVDAGVLVLSTRSMEDGRVWEATVVRVAFRETSPCGGLPASTTPTPTGVTRRVFFTCDETPNAAPVGLLRSVPADAEPLRAVLDALLDGPSAAERAAGFTSWFSAATSGMVTGVEVSDAGDAVVDFADLRPVIPNASASAGSQLLLDQLDATTFQIETVRSVEYRIAGDCEAFFEWLQLAGCEPRRSS